MYDGVGKAIDALFKFAIISAIISWPLAIWKLIEIAIWIFNHVSISVL